jgi:hypothetical protein
MKGVCMTQLLILLTCALFLFSFTACGINRGGIYVGRGGPIVKGGPPPHAPAHGYRTKHVYRYYPGTYVYFDISRKVYFYPEGDKWKMAVALPHSLHVRLGEHVMIEMDLDKPYTRFDSHKKKYPPGQLKKKWTKKKW